MAFVFVPPFNEGDKQTNPDTGVEYAYIDGAWRALGPKIEDEFGTLDERYLQKSGGTLSGPVNFRRGEAKTANQFKISPNGGEDYATNLYSFYGQMRFRTTHTNNEGDHVGSHIVLSSNGGSPETKIYHVVETGDTGAVPRSYVDEKVASAGGGVPVGTIMIWLNSDPPDGWFKLHGGTFDTIANPQLHTYLSKTNGYVAGKLPDWSGRYPGEYGGHLSGTLGTFANPKTAKPAAGAPRSSATIPNGTTRTFNATGGTNAYSNGISKVSIDENWDSTTRPLTVVVHYIIKHD